MSCKDIFALLGKTDQKSIKKIESLFSSCPIQDQQKVLDAHKKMYCSLLNHDSDANKKAFCGKGSETSGLVGSPFSSSRDGGKGGISGTGGKGGLSGTGGKGGISGTGGKGGISGTGGKGGISGTGGKGGLSGTGGQGGNSTYGG